MGAAVRSRSAGGPPGRARSKSFITRALADSYCAELVRAARKGLEFDPQTGEPVLWAEPEPVTVTWYQHAAAYAAMKWPALAAHSRASVAEALATVTPALTRAAPGRPPAAELRTVLYQHAFNPARTATADPATTRVLAWAQQASLPVARLADPLVLRAALDALTLRLDGSRAAANTITRKRAVFHGALGYAVEAGLLESNPADSISWQAPKAATTVDPKVVASPAQAEALLAAVVRIRPALAAFFGCLYYGALRPEEAIALRLADCHLPRRGWGILTLTQAAPRTAAAWTGNGTSHEQRGLKHRPAGAARTVPHPARPGRHAPPSLPLLWHRTRWPAVPRNPRRTAQRKQLRTHLACCPHPGPRARSGCHCSCPPSLRPAARRAVALAERWCRPRPDRATGRAQHHHAPGRLHPLH